MLDAAMLRDALICVGVHAHARHWVPATAGNFSARLDAERCLLTVSGKHKGYLKPDDLMTVALDGRLLEPDKRASAETELHLALYRRYPEVGAVLHVHSPAATVLSRHLPVGVRLRDYELLKILPGINTHAAETWLPVFPNDQDIPRLAAQVDAVMAKHELAAYLIAGHGIYTWGKTVERAWYQLEALEFMLECHYREWLRGQ